MIFAKPKSSTRDQKTHNRGLAIIKNTGPPLLVLALSGIRVFITGCSIKTIKSKLIFRKMSGYPIKDNADSVLVHNINKFFKIIRGAITRCGREIARYLITPRTLKRMLGYGHQLDMGISHLLNVSRKLTRGGIIIERVAVLMPFPRA